MSSFPYETVWRAHTTDFKMGLHIQYDCCALHICILVYMWLCMAEILPVFICRFRTKNMSHLIVLALFSACTHFTIAELKKSAHTMFRIT